MVNVISALCLSPRSGISPRPPGSGWYQSLGLRHGLRSHLPCNILYISYYIMLIIFLGIKNWILSYKNLFLMDSDQKWVCKNCWDGTTGWKLDILQINNGSERCEKNPLYYNYYTNNLSSAYNINQTLIFWNTCTIYMYYSFIVFRYDRNLGDSIGCNQIW